MNIKTTITKYSIPFIYLLLFFIGIKNTFFGKYSIINHIKTKQEIRQLNKIKDNKEQKKTELIYKTKQVKLKKNLTCYTIKKTNIINKEYLIIY